MNFPLIILRCTLPIIFVVQTWLIHPLPSFALTVQQVSNPRQHYHGWVTDMAEILSQSTETQLNQMISDLEAKNGSEIAVVTVPETQPAATPKEFATKLFNYWGIGKKGQDNGVLFLVSVGDRRVEIETGKGIQETLPNAKVSNIIDSKIIPEFKSGNFENGVVAGTKELVTSLKTEKYQLSKTSIAGIFMGIFISIFLVSVLRLGYLENIILAFVTALPNTQTFFIGIGIFIGILVVWMFRGIFKSFNKTQMSRKSTYSSSSSTGSKKTAISITKNADNSSTQTSRSRTGSEKPSISITKNADNSSTQTSNSSYKSSSSSSRGNKGKSLSSSSSDRRTTGSRSTNSSSSSYSDDSSSSSYSHSSSSSSSSGSYDSGSFGGGSSDGGGGGGDW
ncbi:MAG: TPM domain-containing protein [Okeania sp. SIO2F4]|uniref:TPM domain-containing protein n=1 Tax=Okeania sp. SIO2F4 TaxID=2607790 RepID=UPI00142CE1DB|nr:TPM domain-containing protein [Okeania sp. SIO2F4]NES02042.1 TPM domain-containing protein [Okeania sp. SIO2F4]